MADPYAVAKKMYPILRDYPYKIVNTPDEDSPFFLEHFSPGETGSLEMPRPKNISINEYGLQIFKDVRPEDIAGDIISHHLVNEDEYLSEEYQKFKNSTPIETMESIYEYEKNNFGEERDFNSWLERTGYPQLLRGYVFNQFNEEEIDKTYNSKQKEILENIKNYVTKKGMTEGGIATNEQTEMAFMNTNKIKKPTDLYVDAEGRVRRYPSPEGKYRKRVKEEMEDLNKVASFLVPFYDSGVNISNITREYIKPEEERDYDYIKNQFKEAGQSAAIETGLLLLGGVATKYGAKGIKALANKVRQYEINPNVMSAFGAGAIRKRTSLTLDDFGYREDNPITKGFPRAKDWLSGKIKEAGKSEKLLDGATTAFLGTTRDKPLFLDIDFISSLKGASDEVRKKGNLKYDRLKESVDKEGFDPERSEILIEVNHKGEAYIVEGNTRVTLAKELGVPNIKVEIRYKNGAELVDGPFSPQNILKKASTSKKFDRTEDIAEAERLINDPDALKAWQEKEGGKGKRQENPADSEAAAQALIEGSITSKEARKRIGDAIPPPKEYTADEVRKMMPTVTDVTGAMGIKARKFGILGVKGKDGKIFDLVEGQILGTRLDIPAYNKYDKWVVSIHDGGTKEKINLKGSVLGYGQAIRLKNVRFGSAATTALDIARGKRTDRKTLQDAIDKKTDGPAKQDKATIARAVGEYVPQDPYELQEIAADIIESGSKEWTQVGMNPYRGSQFYDKKTGKIIFDAEEMIQVGPLVLAKNAKVATISDLKEMAVRTKDDKLRMFNEGGMTMKDQMEMAFMQEGGLRDDGMEKDPVSGNEVPSGSMAKEVRDDVPAQLSEGEYVVPADVVRYYGVKFFEDLRKEAKIGMAKMEADGRIGGEPVPAGGPVNTEELSPEEMAAIQKAMGMAEGGMADVYEQQQNLYRPPLPQNTNEPIKTYGNIQGYQDSSDVKKQVEQTVLTDAQTAQQTQNQGSPLGFSLFPTQAQIDVQQSGGTKVILYSPEGVETILFSPRDDATIKTLEDSGYTRTKKTTQTSTTTVSDTIDKSVANIMGMYDDKKDTRLKDQMRTLQQNKVKIKNLDEEGLKREYKNFLVTKKLGETFGGILGGLLGRNAENLEKSLMDRAEEIGFNIEELPAETDFNVGDILKNLGSQIKTDFNEKIGLLKTGKFSKEADSDLTKQIKELGLEDKLKSPSGTLFDNPEIRRQVQLAKDRDTVLKKKMPKRGDENYKEKMAEYRAASQRVLQASKGGEREQRDFNKLAKFKVLKGKATNQADIDYLNNQIEYLELKSTNSFAAQRLLRNKRKQAKIDQEAGKTLTRYQKQILGLD